MQRIDIFFALEFSTDPEFIGMSAIAPIPREPLAERLGSASFILARFWTNLLDLQMAPVIPDYGYWSPFAHSARNTLVELINFSYRCFLKTNMAKKGCPAKPIVFGKPHVRMRVHIRRIAAHTAWVSTFPVVKKKLFINRY